jgi:hypothetical protein
MTSERSSPAPRRCSTWPKTLELISGSLSGVAGRSSRTAISCARTPRRAYTFGMAARCRHRRAPSLMCCSHESPMDTAPHSECVSVVVRDTQWSGQPVRRSPWLADRDPRPRATSQTGRRWLPVGARVAAVAPRPSPRFRAKSVFGPLRSRDAQPERPRAMARYRERRQRRDSNDARQRSSARRKAAFRRRLADAAPNHRPTYRGRAPATAADGPPSCARRTSP